MTDVSRMLIGRWWALVTKQARQQLLHKNASRDFWLQSADFQRRLEAFEAKLSRDLKSLRDDAASVESQLTGACADDADNPAVCFVAWSQFIAAPPRDSGF